MAEQENKERKTIYELKEHQVDCNCDCGGTFIYQHEIKTKVKFYGHKCDKCDKVAILEQQYPYTFKLKRAINAE